MPYARSPWEVYTYGNFIKTVYGNPYMDNSELIPCTLTDGRLKKENGLLIAASPELLESLRGIIEIGKRDMTNSKYDEYFVEAKRVIDKALGKEK
jgi:hypothetical protein